MSKNTVLLFCTILVIGVLIFTFIMEFGMKKWKCVDKKCIKVLGGDYSSKDKCEEVCQSNVDSVSDSESDSESDSDSDSDSETNSGLVVSPTYERDIVVNQISDYGYPYNYGYVYDYGTPYYNSLYPYSYNRLYDYAYDRGHNKHIHHHHRGKRKKSKGNRSINRSPVSGGRSRGRVRRSPASGGRSRRRR